MDGKGWKLPTWCKPLLWREERCVQRNALADDSLFSICPVHRISQTSSPMQRTQSCCKSSKTPSCLMTYLTASIALPLSSRSHCATTRASPTADSPPPWLASSCERTRIDCDASAFGLQRSLCCCWSCCALCCTAGNSCTRARARGAKVAAGLCDDFELRRSRVPGSN
ncbi:hypothetical protein IE81DRAFT_16744 [Ceraceosorus guamensis]|uniref:Uncharacterized protein n=1 Tax=Ceraceosorus guamensis TaxID=1522189 RepID=A0A316VVW6_9BASI|nr:hypothetical protein IE81DRAFT_16744 [Ceraceosorus guamensis]PWN39585.1 hypothetical protein IE81DRAFT_16744 [Ceraceosorus guamensis]